MFSLLAEAVSEANFRDYEKLKILIAGAATSMKNSLAHNGHAYARSVAASKLTPAKVCL
jgi:Zn-dependent M16 (insulinase) family peptidase